MCGTAPTGASIAVDMTGRVSIRDVAREAGVSVTTVSHALNGKGRLNPDTRRRVREVADRLGYRPNPAARSLVSGRTGLIAVVPSFPPGLDVDFADFGFFSDLIVASTGVSVDRGQALIVAPPAASWFIWDRVALDGVIVIEPVLDEPRLPDLRRRGIPFVTIAPDPAGGEHDAVVRADDGEGSARLLDHLVDRGAERVAMLGPPPMNAFTRDVTETYRRWCARANRPLILELVEADDLRRGSEQAYDQALRRILDRSPRPDALFVPIELAGVRTLEAIQAAGLRVPDDMLLATTNDTGRGAQATPALTTLEWDYQDLGRRAANLLLDLIDGTATTPCEIVVPTTLVPRDSTLR
jgi:DNA-binding LacI/PurR family transcriptional regulator